MLICQEEMQIRFFFKTDPKSAWDTVFQLIGGFGGHHQTYRLKRISNEQGKVATTDRENADILSNHYSKVFNQNAPYDPTVINKLDQKPQANPMLGIAPNIKEVKAMINKMKNNKAPGITGVTTDLLKNLPEEGFKFLTNII